MPDWSWKSKCGAAGRLLYEPGNWGDLLKTLWIASALRWLLRHAPADDAAGVSCLDPFAGAPAYPAGVKTLRRLRQCHSPELTRLTRAHVEQNRWPGSSTLMADLLSEGGAADPRRRVWSFDADGERARALAATGRFGMLECASGWEALAAGVPGLGDWGLALVDPYDWLADWREQLAALLALAERTTVLVYVYNRSPRGAEAFREYRAFRNELEERWGERTKRIGRIPADAFLPSAWHEIVLLPGARARAHPAFAELTVAVEQATARLAEAVRDAETLEE